MIRPPLVTGFGSVTAFGPASGLLSNLEIAPEPASWLAEPPRRAYTVKPFQASTLVPGAKTRRLDRLSTWTLVASHLALNDAGIDLETIDRSRVAVLFASGYGCVELTGSFFSSAHKNGWAGTDPITFPETLANAPAAHAALFHRLQGPNLTLCHAGFAAEYALQTAASLLRHGQADRVIVAAGDALCPALYAWFEEARLLSPECFGTGPVQNPAGLIPSEGVVALVLEAESSAHGNGYARLLDCQLDADAERIRPLASGATRIFCSGGGSPCLTHDATEAVRALAGPSATIFAAHPAAHGLAESGGLLHLLLALSQHPAPGPALQLGCDLRHYFGLQWEVL